MAAPSIARRTPCFGRVAALLGDCPSTQDVVREAGAGAPEGFIAVTDHQTAGRGRRGRTWHDHPGQALMFSLLLRPRTPLDALSPITLVAATAVAEALPVAARVRWPNDVVVGGRKIAGLIAELETPAGTDPYVILGVGINVNMPATAAPPTDRLEATSLLMELGGPVDRLELLYRVIAQIEAAYLAFEERGFAALVDRYRDLDDLAGRGLTLALGSETVAGTSRGVDVRGRLLLETAGGEQSFDAGEVVSVGGG